MDNRSRSHHRPLINSGASLTDGRLSLKVTFCHRKSEYARGVGCRSTQTGKEKNDTVANIQNGLNLKMHFLNHSDLTENGNAVSIVHGSLPYFSVSSASWLNGILDSNQEDATASSKVAAPFFIAQRQVTCSPPHCFSHSARGREHTARFRRQLCHTDMETI